MRTPSPFRLAACAFAALLIAGSANAVSSQVASPIQEDLATGHAADALARINSEIAKDPQDAKAFELKCRVMLQERRYKDAVDACQEAVKLEPDSSETHMWLGRAYGEEARTAEKLAAFGLARKLRAEYERAVQLDPNNKEAYEALGNFYVQAPGIVGGGIGKADRLEKTLQAIDPTEAQELAAKLAENHHDFAEAERDWKAAIQTSSHPARAWMDLAEFYYRRNEIPEMLQAVETGAAADPQHGLALVQGAELLMRSGQELPEAAHWLREYLASSHQSEEAPAFVVHAELAQVLSKMGDGSAAQQELATAHLLAPGYTPNS